MNQKFSTNLISVSGFGYSGSGLIIDFLNSSNNTIFPQVEFRLLKDVDGLLSLRNFFVNGANYMNTDIALQRFYRFCLVLARNNNILFGMGYDRHSKNTFLEHVNVFINEIVVDKYWSDAFVFKYHKSDFSQILWKVFRKLKYKISSDKRVIPVSIEEFDKSVNKFLNNLFKDMSDNSDNYLIIDNGIDATAINSYKEFIGSTKCLVVGRDPRDTYTDLVNSKDVFYDVDQFIYLYKKMRQMFHKNSHKLENVLFIQFESFLTSFEIEAKRVIEFTKGFSDDFSLDNCLNYNYNNSLKNIGIHKNFNDQIAIKKIENELKEYCFYKK